MKLKYRVHHKPPVPPDGTTALPFGDPAMQHVESNGQEKPIFHESKEAAEICLLEHLREERLPGVFADYVLQPYDMDGYPVEKVEDVDSAQAAADAQHLGDPRNNPEVHMAVSTLLAARQLYAFGMQELELQMEKATVPGTCEVCGGDGAITVDLNPDDSQSGPCPDPACSKGVKIRPPHPLTVQMLIQAATNKSAMGFEQIDMFEGMTHSVLPWVKKVVERNVKLDVKEREVEAVEREETRKKTQVPIGIPLDKSMPPTMGRDKPLILVGYGKALQYVLDQIANTILATQVPEHPNRTMTVIRLCDAPQIKPSENDRLVVVGSQAWEGSATTEKRWIGLLANAVQPQIKYMPDVLMVDDIAASYGGGVVTANAAPTRGGFAPFRVAEAMRKLNNWCKGKVTCLLIGGVPCDSEQVPALMPNEWDRVNTHGVVRVITVIRKAEDLEAGKVRIMVGNDLARFDVDPSVLESDTPSIIIQ